MIRPFRKVGVKVRVSEKKEEWKRRKDGLDSRRLELAPNEKIPWSMLFYYYNLDPGPDPLIEL